MNISAYVETSPSKCVRTSFWLNCNVSIMGSNMLLNASYVVLLAYGLSCFVVIDMTVSVIAQATLIIFIGSFRSLNLRATTESVMVQRRR